MRDVVGIDRVTVMRRHVLHRRSMGMKRQISLLPRETSLARRRSGAGAALTAAEHGREFGAKAFSGDAVKEKVDGVVETGQLVVVVGG